MAKITLTKKGKSKTKSISKSNFILPQKDSIPVIKLDEYTILLYGEPKIGKTSFLSHFSNSYFAMCEPGGKALRLRQSPINNWETFLEMLDALETSPNYCNTVIIDTGYRAYEHCYSYVLENCGADSVKDAGYGFWKDVDNEFKLAHERIINMGLGLCITAHCDEQEIIKHGFTRHKTTTQLGKQATRFYTSVIDIIAYYHFDDDGNRWLTIRGDDTRLAGTRTEGRFLYTDGTPISDISMGNTSKEAYDNFVRAFECKLINPERKKGGLARKGKLVLK